jgi:biopolymer transport protein ExbB
MRQAVTGALIAALWLAPLVAIAQQAQPAEPAPPAAPAATPEAAAQAAPEVPVRVPVQGEAAPEDSRTLGDWYRLGGWVMHVLVACSVISLALVMERAWSTRRSAVISRRFLKRMREHWNRRDLPQVLSICRDHDSAIARVLRVGLVHMDQGLAHMQDAVESQTVHETTVLRRNLPLLAALGNIATMLGLLGTVLGMIESFDLIAKTGTGDARVVAGGIFTALVTTAAGLMVGITTLLAHSFFRRRVDVLEIDLSEISLRLLEDLVEERSSSATRLAASTPGALEPAEV